MTENYRDCKKAIVYIGDFDFRNENVQSHFVKNMGKLFTQLEYEVYFIGINKNSNRFTGTDLTDTQAFKVKYLELPYTLTPEGLLKIWKVKKIITSFLNDLIRYHRISAIITYQAPTYSSVLNEIIKWCKHNHAAYVVNCADLPVFDSQPFVRKVVMNVNWKHMHQINKIQADGIIAVSKFIANFYEKKNRPSVVIPPLFDKPEFAISDSIESNKVATFLYAGTPFVITGHEINIKGMKDRLDKIVDLMARLELTGMNFVFQVVGITLNEYLLCVPRHKETLEKSKSIVFYGKKTHQETLVLLSQADYMINYRDKNTMTEAGMSTKVVESVSVGTPVVMNEIGDTFLYLQEGVSGIKLTGDIGFDIGIVERLCMISGDKRKENKEKVRMSGTFSLEKYKEPLVSFINSVEGTRHTL